MSHNEPDRLLFFSNKPSLSAATASLLVQWKKIYDIISVLYDVYMHMESTHAAFEQGNLQHTGLLLLSKGGKMVEYMK